ncbi:PQQ-dependent sugar dehydrogenase [uncultured Corynebacterium sp.]|uniref:PQQ-dependent sugar dehydrogenase n=1 Tax=uncultured Corynebacterium sp. TaxID=159447 RepID=UPI0025E34DC0|nr:PQQ-dependent sugar dehydrogenase [uncultured Corynebacterium sp.]
MRRLLALTAAASLLLAACSDDSGGPGGASDADSAGGTGAASPDRAGGDGGDGGAGVVGEVSEDFTVTEQGTFDEGWAMAFLPGTDHLLITERGGGLKLRNQNSGEVVDVAGAPEVHAAGQAGMHDVIPGPTFDEDGTVYLSWVRDDPDGAQGVVGRGRLDVDGGRLSDLDVIWEQTPAAGDGHLSLRMLVQGEHLFVTSGDRQEFTPAQDTSDNLGSIVRLTLDGEPARGNPWAGEGGSENGAENGAAPENKAAELWTIGHRNPLGIAEDVDGNIWSSEMGPQGGDELNRIDAGANYGWPEASMGVHYDGEDIPDHADGDGFTAPEAHWVPAISPGNLMIYRGSLFDGWSNSALLGGLSGQKIVRVELDGDAATIAEEWDMGERIRAIDEAPDGSLWVLEDGAGGRLLELRPK